MLPLCTVVNIRHDRRLQEPWFNIGITLQCGESPQAVSGSSLRKPWSEFQRLHYLLLTDEFGCNEDVKEKLPALPPGPAEAIPGGIGGVSGGGGDVDVGGYGGGVGSGGGSGGGDSVDIARALDVYLKALLAVPAVVQSQVFSGFMEEHSRCHADMVGEEEEKKGGGGCGSGNNGYGGEGGPKNPETAIDFLLQPFECRKVYVPRRAEHTERIDVLHGESVVWKFEVMDSLDVDFSVMFRPHPLPVLSPHTGGDDHEAAVAASAAAAAEDLPAGAEACLSSPGPRGDEGDEPPVDGVNDVGNANAGGASAAEGRPRRWWGIGSGVGDGGSGESRSDPKTGAGAREGGERERQGPPKDRAVHLPTRYSTVGGDLVQGSFTCPADGT